MDKMNLLALNPVPKPTFLVLVLVTVVGWLLSKAFTAVHRSRRLGILAVASGVAAFIPALIGPVFSYPNQKNILAACGMLCLVLAILAIGLALWAFGARRRVMKREQAVPTAYPVIGLLFGAINLFCGTGLLVTGSGTLAPSETVQRTWRSDAHGFEVAIPSENWSEKPNPNVLASFNGNRPSLVAIVAEVRSARTDAEYDEAVAFGRKIQADTPTTDTVERLGINPKGLPHWIYMGEAKSDRGGYYFGVSITRVRDKAVVLLFEGQSRLKSEAGKAQEDQALRTQADLFLGSIRTSLEPASR